MAREWAEDIRRACRGHGTAFFFKQGAVLIEESGLARPGRTYDEFPERVVVAQLNIRISETVLVR